MTQKVFDVENEKDIGGIKIMTDRFKFRVWFEGRFIYKSLCDSNVYTEDDKCICIANILPDLPWEQCTGLKDKNGKLIYENDIIRIDGYDAAVMVDDYGCWCICPKGNPLKGCIEWNDVVKECFYDHDNISVEVVGNIHENKELLDD